MHPSAPLARYLILTGFVLLAAVALLALPILATSPLPALAAPVACEEVLRNGDLETSVADNWRFGSTAAPGAVVATPVHGGSSAIRLGIPPSGNNVLTHSTVYQTVTIPANAQQLTLTYWERTGPSGDAGDRRELLVLNTNFNVIAQLDTATGGGNDTWTARSYPLLDTLPNLAGQTVVFYWNVYNNGSGSTLVSYLDDLSLQACDGAPTATATVVAATATAAATPTVAATPDPVRVRAGTITVAPAATTATVPLDVIVLTDRLQVGLLSATIGYDETLLKATGCAQTAAVDLLLCNVATPGVVQLAGVSALGLGGETTVANLTFELLVNSDRITPLTVDLKLIGDGSGTAVSATPLNGAIDLSCTEDAENCDRGNVIYLPVIRR